jgi:hypothetical protein
MVTVGNGASVGTARFDGPQSVEGSAGAGDGLRGEGGSAAGGWTADGVVAIGTRDPADAGCQLTSLVPFSTATVSPAPGGKVNSDRSPGRGDSATTTRVRSGGVSV